MKNPLQTETLRRVQYWLRHTFRQLQKHLPGQSRTEEEAPRRSLDWTQTGTLRQYGAFSFAPGAALYFALLAGSLIFTQILRSRASHIFFLFVLLLLPVSVVYTFTSRLWLHVYLENANTTVEVEKCMPYAYELRMMNTGLFAYPFVDAVVRIPRKDAVRTSRRQLRMSLLPLSTYTLQNTVTFRFRGTYEVGVTCFYVYDFFRIFRIRVDVESYSRILVMPRKHTREEETAVAVSDMSRQTTRSPFAFDRMEVLDTREYRTGDSLKTVHWKLSSKAESLIVRDYSSGSSNRTVIYCDMAARFSEAKQQGEAETDTAVGTPAKKSRKERLEAQFLAQEKERLARSAARRAAAEGNDAAEQSRADADAATLRTEDPDVRDIAEKDVMKRSSLHAGTAKGLRYRRREAGELDATETGGNHSAPQNAAPDVQELADPAYYADMNEYCADGVMEIAISTVLRELRAGNGCTLMWFDPRAELGAFGFDLKEESDFDAIFRLFATAPLCPPGDGVWKLRSMLGDTQGLRQVFVTASLDKEAIARFCSIPVLAGGGNLGSAELLYYNPAERFRNPTERRRYLESCQALLCANGITMTDGSARMANTSAAGKENR